MSTSSRRRNRLMWYRKYGLTGVEVSAIGFGGMRFADHENWEKGAALVKAAYEAGINYFDTAPGYGKSEDIFGTAFKEMKKTRETKPFYVSTKTFAAEPDSMRRDLEKSLERMGLDYVDFYHLWCIMTLDGYRERKAKGALREMERLKDEGLIKHICVSSHMTGTDIGELLAEYPFAGLLVGYSVMNFAYREASLDAAAARNMGVVIMNPLGGGLIPQNPDRFSFARTQPGETVVEAALRFLLNDRRVTVALVGLSDTAQLEEALGAVEGFKPIGQEQYARVRASLQESFNELCTSCGYCDECPEGIPVPRYLEAYNHYALGGEAKDIINRLRWHWSIGADDDYLERCTECGLCEEKCTQHLPIRQRLQEIRRVVDKARRGNG
jgi:predicted aldo/keto reductase-like oxidoreductase